MYLSSWVHIVPGKSFAVEFKLHCIVLRYGAQSYFIFLVVEICFMFHVVICFGETLISFCKRCPRCVSVCGFYFWILQLLVNMYIPMQVTGPRGIQNISMSTNYRYCSSPVPKTYIFLLNAVLYFAIDAICLVFMILASGSMVLVLHKHKQQVQHIHSHSLSLRLSPEDRATHTILRLVTMFVFFFGLSSISTLCLILTRNPNKRLIDAAAFLAACFPAFSPFLLISCDTRVSHIFDMCCRKKSLS